MLLLIISFASTLPCTILGFHWTDSQIWTCTSALKKMDHKWIKFVRLVCLGLDSNSPHCCYYYVNLILLSTQFYQSVYVTSICLYVLMVSWNKKIFGSNFMKNLGSLIKLWNIYCFASISIINFKIVIIWTLIKYTN